MTMGLMNVAVSGSSVSQQPVTGFAETLVCANTSDYTFMTGGTNVLRVWELDKASMKVTLIFILANLIHI
jgi:hypothetical protein